MTTSFSCFILLMYSILFHDIPGGKFAEATKNGAIVILYVTISLEYCILVYHKESINNLIDIMNEDYRQAKESSEEEKDIVLRYSKKGVRVCKYWLASACATGSVFPVKAFVLMIYYYCRGQFMLVPMFELTYPKIIEDYKNTAQFFWPLFMLQLAFDIYNTTVLIGFDSLVPVFMLHASGQVDLLNERIKNLFADAEDLMKIEEELKQINIKLQHVYEFVDGLKRNFTLLFEYIMKTTTILLPLTAFQIVESLRHKEINVEFISFFTGCILHFYMPCYYSDLLMETSEKFRQAIYTCSWEKCPDRRVRKTILVMMTRTTFSIRICTVFHVVCLDTFAEMCRQSYGIFNLMNAAWT